jgi:hypothetical protein
MGREPRESREQIVDALFLVSHADPPNARAHRRRVNEANEGTPSPQGEGRPRGARC